MTELEQLRKENQRLADALAKAQRLNDGLGRDKDQAFELLQLVVMRQSSSRSYVIHARDLKAYDPKRWILRIAKDPTSGDLHLSVKDSTHARKG